MFAVDPTRAAAPGWFNHGDKILALVEQVRPVVCVELGSFQGASAIPVALAIRRWGGTLTCVDHWAAEATAANPSPWMLLACARHLIQAGVNANVRLIASTTTDAAPWWDRPLDYLYIDADHSYEGVRADLALWAPFVKPGGLLLGDDYGNAMYPGVQQAWDEFERAHDLTLTRYQGDAPDPHGIQLIYGVLP